MSGVRKPENVKITDSSMVIKESGLTGFGKAYIVEGLSPEQLQQVKNAFDALKDQKAKVFDKTNRGVSELVTVNKEPIRITVSAGTTASATVEDEGKTKKLSGQVKNVEINGKQIKIFIPSSVKRNIKETSPAWFAVLAVIMILLVVLLI